MSIKIISEDFPEDENGNNNKYFKTSELIAQMELDSICGQPNDEIKLVYLFSENYPNWKPTITMIETECSDNDISKEIEQRVNDRLSQIASSNEMEFYYEKTDDLLYAKIVNLHQTKFLKEEALSLKKSNEYFFNNNPVGSPLVTNLSNANNVLYLLMASCNNAIHPETAQRIQDRLSKD